MTLTVIFSFRNGVIFATTHIAGAGVVVLAIGVGFGLAVIQSYQWHVVTLAGFSIVLGVGMDDVFVMTNAFRMTNPALSVPDRLSKSYEEAAVSITLTSATNTAAFAIGALTANYGTVHLFCAFCGWAIAAIYFFTVIMFGAVIANAALAEEWLKKKEWYSEFASCYSDKINVIFRYLLRKIFHLPEGFDLAYAVGKWLTSIVGLTIVSSALLVYLVVAVYYAAQLPTGILPSVLSDETSYSHKFYDLEYEMFQQFRFRLHVVIPEKLDFADAGTRKQVEGLLKSIRNSSFISDNVPELEENWMEQFRIWNGGIADWKLFAEDIQTFLDDAKGSRIFDNIKLSEDNLTSSSAVLASRFVLQSGTVVTPEDMTKFMSEVRTEARHAPFPVIVFNPVFIWFDQLAKVEQDTINSCLICFVTVAAATYLLLFNVTAVFLICLMIISIYLGVFGCMSVLSINFDFVSMICLIMSAGFSVDFSVHITQHCILSRGGEGGVTSKITSAMRAYGLPVFQSAFSTTIVVVPLLAPSSYILRSFAKTVIAVVFLGAVHGLVVLPALLAAYYNRRNIVGPVKAFVSGMKGALMLVRRRMVRSADVMDSGTLGAGTFRPITFGRLLESENRELSVNVAPPTTRQEEVRTLPSQSHMHDSPEESMDRESTRMEDNRLFELRDQLCGISLADESFDLGTI